MSDELDAVERVLRREAARESRERREWAEAEARALCAKLGASEVVTDWIVRMVDTDRKGGTLTSVATDDHERAPLEQAIRERLAVDGTTPTPERLTGKAWAEAPRDEQDAAAMDDVRRMRGESRPPPPTPPPKAPAWDPPEVPPPKSIPPRPEGGYHTMNGIDLERAALDEMDNIRR